jgi:hypothetical protein
MVKMTCQQRPAITREQELELLAEIYRLALESYRKRKNEEGGFGAALNDAERRLNGVRARNIIPK